MKFTNILKSGFLLVFGGILLSGIFVFAEDATNQTIYQDIFDWIKSFVLFMSRAWVIPATIAGKLMTNELIYFKAINMGTFLWRVRNIMRSMANYAVGVIFLWQIIKAVMGLDFGVSKLFDSLKSVVIAVIGINISWFVIAAVVDMSIVGAAAVSSFPYSVMQQIWPTIKNETKIPKSYTVSRDSQGVLKSCGSWKDTTTENTGFTVQNILPTADNVAGPLVFLGASVFRNFEVSCIDIANTSSRQGITLGLLLQIIIIVLFAIPIIILCVVNMMRIFWIWIWIMLSPIIVLDMAFDTKIEGKVSNSTLKNLFDRKEFLGVVFQPVVTVAMLGISLVFLMGIHSMLVGGSEAQRKDSLAQLYVRNDTDNKVHVCPDGICDTIISGKLLSDAGSDVGKFTVKFILAFLTSFLLRKLVQFSFSFSKIFAKTTEGMYSFAEQAMGAIPIPGTGGVGAGAIASGLQSGGEEVARSMRNRLDPVAQKYIDDMDKATGIKRATGWKSGDLKVLEDRAVSKDDNALSTKIREYKSSEDYKNTSFSYKEHKKPLVTSWLTSPNRKDFLTKNMKTLGLNQSDVDNMTNVVSDVSNRPKLAAFIDSMMQGNGTVKALEDAMKVTAPKSDLEKKVYNE